MTAFRPNPPSNAALSVPGFCCQFHFDAYATRVELHLTLKKSNENSALNDLNTEALQS
jgi:hypothetical protein